MRAALGVIGLVTLLATPSIPQAQPRPPGSYERQCRDIRMNGRFLSAWCQGARGSGRSEINVDSCRSDIWVNETGGLTCDGRPGGGPGGPGWGGPGPGGPGWGGPGWGGPGGPGGPRPPGGGVWSARLFEGPNFRGRSLEVVGDMSNLDRTGLNDRVGSIQFNRRSGPWQICTDAKYRGRCTVIRGDIRDTGQLGMANSISSLRPAR